jgi:hypothetical protein
MQICHLGKIAPFGAAVLFAAFGATLFPRHQENTR